MMVDIDLNSCHWWDMNGDVMNYNDIVSIYISDTGLYLDPVGQY